MKPLIFTFLFSLLSAGAMAQTPVSYYVDVAAAGPGDGTAANPWNKIFYAINRARDTTREAIVYIKGGIYRIDSTDYTSQLYIGPDNGGVSGKYLTLKTYPGDEGKVIIDGGKLATTAFYPNMLIIASAKYVKLQNLVFRGLKNTAGYVLNIQNAANIQVNNCVFDTLKWTTVAAEAGYPTVNNTSYFIHAAYVQNSSQVSFTADTLKNSALGWGELIRDAGGNTSLTSTGLVLSGNTAIASAYYVATSGNDTTGSGSFGKPWRTIKKAIELAGINYTYPTARLVNSDVTVNLRGGTHKPTGAGLFIGSNRGTNGKWFTIRNYPGENAIVDGSNLNVKFASLLAISDARYIRIEGLKLTKVTSDSVLQYASPSPGVKDTRFGIIVSGKSSNIIIRKNSIYDMAWTRTTSRQKTPSASDNLNPLVILGTTDTAIRNVIIDSNEVYNNITGYAEAVTVNGNVDSFAITNNLVHDNANIGIVAAGHYHWVEDDPGFSVTAPFNYSRNGFIRSNDVFRNISPVAVSAGIYLDGSSNVLVEDNESYKNGTGISIGNEQSNSVSGNHLVQSNEVHDNLSAGLFYGSTNSTSWVENCTVKDNTIRNNYILDSALRARANNMYGITNASQRYTEANIYRLRNSVFEQNTIESLSDIVLGLYLTHNNLTFRYNNYYVISESACQALFVEDKNNDGSIALPTDSIYAGFQRYASATGLDHTSETEGIGYGEPGCNGSAARGLAIPETMVPVAANKTTVYPNPVKQDLVVNLSSSTAERVTITLNDVNGRRLFIRQQQLVVGQNQFRIDNVKANGLKPGIYFLSVLKAGKPETFKVAVE
ncbi:MAG: T9SS type A sorting domain-containing protein [Chitinophagaceae bacterium]|nr:MAG: T9SS type A sorting domain-containing protein [Chitinophagaceae bacterium]